MKRLNIALMAGGDSSEREIALQSAAQIASALDPAKYDITLIDLHGRDWHYTSPDGRQWQVDKNDFSITIDGDRKTFDYALILIHGTPGENGRLQGYLDMMEIPYSSCSMTSSVVTFDKITTKRTVAEFGIPLARGFFFSRDSRIDPKEIVRTLGLPVFVKPNASGSSFGVTKVKSEADILPAVAEAFTESDEILIEECIQGREMGCGMLIAKGRSDPEFGIPLARGFFFGRDSRIDPQEIVRTLGLPVFVKPNSSGSSFGVTKVKSEADILPAVAEAFTESDEILIEECIRGREMGCGMLIAKGREYIFPITEIVSKKEFFDYEAKYTAGCSDEITPADIAPEIKAELNRLTALAYKACRCRGVVRVDFIVTPEGKPYLIEINSIPGMSGGSIVPKQVREAGMTLGELYDLIIEDTYDRDRR